MNMGDFSIQDVGRKKQDFGNDDDDKPSAAEFAKALLLGNVGLFGEADSDKDVRQLLRFPHDHHTNQDACP